MKNNGNNDPSSSNGFGKFLGLNKKTETRTRAKPWAPRGSVRTLETGAGVGDTTSTASTPAQPSFRPSAPTNTAPKTAAAQAGIKSVNFDGQKWLARFWTFASSLSLIVNLILIVALIILGRELFTLKAMVGTNLVGGLYENFIFMDQAHIKTNINVADNIPVNFTLPISQDTIVTLTQDTRLNGATVRLNSGGVSINSTANIILPAGTNLPVHLELSVPVTTTIPIKINVPVDIPLAQTDLHKPFIGLQQVVAPFYNMLLPQIKRPSDVAFCRSMPFLCDTYFK